MTTETISCAERKYFANVTKEETQMFNYHCNCCGFDFFMEEGYDETIDAIVCPQCEAKRYDDNDDYIIEVI